MGTFKFSGIRFHLIGKGAVLFMSSFPLGPARATISSSSSHPIMCLIPQQELPVWGWNVLREGSCPASRSVALVQKVTPHSSAMTQTKLKYDVEGAWKPHPLGAQISLAVLSFHDQVAMTAQCSSFPPMKPAYTW